MKKPNKWQRFHSSRSFPILIFGLFIILIIGGTYWWYKYRWNLPIIQNFQSANTTSQTSPASIIISSSNLQMNATNNYDNGVELTIELRDQNGIKVKSDGSRIITLTTDSNGSTFESDNMVTIKDGDYDASTRYKSTKAGTATITASTSDMKPATIQIFTIAGAPSGLSAISLRGNPDTHELKSQTEYSFETNLVDSFGNKVVQPATINWQVTSDQTTYQIKTNNTGSSIFNYVFNVDSAQTKTIRADLGGNHQEYPVTITP